MIESSQVCEDKNACVPGAQTERRGEATRPVRDLLTGESSPAGFSRGASPAVEHGNRFYSRFTPYLALHLRSGSRQAEKPDLRTTDPQKLPGFRPEAGQLVLVNRVVVQRFLVLLHPLGSPLVPFVRLVLMAKLPVGHRQEEVIEGVTPLAQLHRLVERLNRRRPGAGAVVSRAERIPVVACLWRQPNRLCGQLDCTFRIAER